MEADNHEYKCDVCKHRYNCVRVDAFLMANVYPYSDGCENFEEGGADMRNITETPSSCITTNPNSVEAYYQSLKEGAE